MYHGSHHRPPPLQQNNGGRLAVNLRPVSDNTPPDANSVKSQTIVPPVWIVVVVYPDRRQHQSYFMYRPGGAHWPRLFTTPRFFIAGPTLCASTQRRRWANKTSNL